MIRAVHCHCCEKAPQTVKFLAPWERKVWELGVPQGAVLCPALFGWPLWMQMLGHRVLELPREAFAATPTADSVLFSHPES